MLSCQVLQFCTSLCNAVMSSIAVLHLLSQVSAGMSRTEVAQFCTSLFSAVMSSIAVSHLLTT